MTEVKDIEEELAELDEKAKAAKAVKKELEEKAKAVKKELEEKAKAVNNELEELEDKGRELRKKLEEQKTLQGYVVFMHERSAMMRCSYPCGFLSRC